MSENHNQPHTPSEFLTDAIPLAEVEPTDHDLVSKFVVEQIRLWGEDSVQRMFDAGFEPVLTSNRKVLWAK